MNGPEGAGGTPRVLLIGMMAAGKSSVGRALAARTGWPYLDNDELVHRATGHTTPEVLATADEPTLRRVEAAALDEALAADPPVVACAAGGVIIDPEARHRLTDAAFVVYLRAPLEVLVERAASGEGRPWLGEDPPAAYARLYEGREPLYCEAADLVLDVVGSTPAELADRIVAELGDRGSGVSSFGSIARTGRG